MAKTKNRAEKIVASLEITFNATKIAREELAVVRDTIRLKRARLDEIEKGLNVAEKVLVTIEEAREEYDAKAREIDERHEKLDDELAEKQAEAEGYADAIVENAKETSVTMLEVADAEVREKLGKADEMATEVIEREAAVTEREGKVVEAQKKLDARALEFASK